MAKEIERKWVVDEFPDVEFEDTETVYMTQWYIDGVRYRKVLFRDYSYQYIRTVKTGFGLSRDEDEFEMEMEEFEDIVHASGSTGLRKIRYKMPWMGYTIEFDEMLDYPNTYYAEIEFPSEKEALDFSGYPEWFGKEVTYDTNHSMYAHFMRLNDE